MIRRRLAALGAALILALSFAGSVQAHVIQRPITGCDTSIVTQAFGSQNYVQQTHRLTLCFNSYHSNLALVTDDDSASCMQGLVDWGHWSNCITSIDVVFSGGGAGKKLCLYDGPNFTGDKLTVVGTWSSPDLGSGGGWGDKISSYRHVGVGVNC